jgi:hypothetical protein
LTFLIAYSKTKLKKQIRKEKYVQNLCTSRRRTTEEDCLFPNTIKLHFCPPLLVPLYNRPVRVSTRRDVEPMAEGSNIGFSPKFVGRNKSSVRQNDEKRTMLV